MLKDIQELCKKWNELHCVPPLDLKEFERQWKCALKFAAAKINDNIGKQGWWNARWYQQLIDEMGGQDDGNKNNSDAESNTTSNDPNQSKSTQNSEDLILSVTTDIDLKKIWQQE